MNFGQALESLKLGGRVARAGWNGKGMWLALTPATAVDPEVCPLRGAAESYYSAEKPALIMIGAHIDMRAADGTLVVGWLASQTDMLAEDWELVS